MRFGLISSFVIHNPGVLILVILSVLCFIFILSLEETRYTWVMVDM